MDGGGEDRVENMKKRVLRREKVGSALWEGLDRVMSRVWSVENEVWDPHKGPGLWGGGWWSRVKRNKTNRTWVKPIKENPEGTGFPKISEGALMDFL